MKPEKNYEDLIRAAFGHFLNKEIKRWGDPAGLANTDVYSDRKICKVKVALGYSMEIFINEIINKKTPSESEIQRLDDFVCRIINAVDLNKVHDIKVEFEDTVLDRYYTLKNGKRSLK